MVYLKGNLFMISVVIPAYNEEKTIQKCLESLVNQKTKRSFEVILVDNASTDKTVEISQKFKIHLNLRILHENKKGRGAARRTGFKAAAGDVIFSTDADTQVPSNWIDTFFTTLTNSKAIAVTGNNRITDCSKTTNTIYNALQPVFMRGYRVLFGHYWLSGFSFAIYKDAYDKSGGFKYELISQEDIDLSFRVRKLGKIQYVGELPVVFSGRRYKKNLALGLVQHPLTFTESFLLRRKNVNLPDIR